MPLDVRKSIPNALTLGRLALSLVFFAMLAAWGLADEDRADARVTTTYLNVATLVYVVAAATDFLDGYLARRWGAVSVFGRVVDPFVDKILVLGAFIYFAGPAFARPGAGMTQTLTGVTPTVVVILLGREFLVTTLRAVAEGGGVDFGAAWAGKLKLVFQCVTIFVILAYVNYRPMLLRIEQEALARAFRDGCVWLTVAVTVLSAWTYVSRSLWPKKG